MARGGHNAKPNEVKRKQGNPGKRAVKTNVLLGTRKAPAMPPSLSARAKTAWKQIVPALEKAGVLQDIDQFALEALCIQVGYVREAQSQIAKDGLISKGSRGQLRKHPAHSIVTEGQREIRAWCERFGLEPATRGKINLDLEGGKDLEDELEDQLGPPELRVVK